MNETEKERILRMISEGTLRPNEAAHLLAALSEESADTGAKSEEAKEKPKQQLLEVQMQRPDGTHYTLELPPTLVPMFLKMAGVAIRESARVASQEAWSGFKNIVRTKANEVKTNVTARVSGPKKESAHVVTPEQEQQAEARRRIIQMVQNGRITATDASRLIEQLDALSEFQRTATPVPAGNTK